MSIGTKIRKTRELKGLTAEDLAAAIGKNQSTVKFIETGRTKRPDKDTLKAIAEYLQMDANEIYRGFGYTEEGSRLGSTKTPINCLVDLELGVKSMIPVYAQVAAGTGIEAITWVSRDWSKPVPPSIRAFLVKGYSQEPLISEGDIVVVDTAKECKNNDYIICLIDGTVSIKQVIFRDGEKYLKNTDGEFTPEQCQSQGVIVSVIKNLS